MASQKMRAVVIVSHGDVEGLEVREVERPIEVSADRVLVRVREAHARMESNESFGKIVLKIASA